MTAHPHARQHWLFHQRDLAFRALELLDVYVGRHWERTERYEEEQPDDEQGLLWVRRDYGNACSVLARCRRAFIAIEEATLIYLGTGDKPANSGPLRHLGDYCITVAREVERLTLARYCQLDTISCNELDVALAVLDGTTQQEVT